MLQWLKNAIMVKILCCLMTKILQLGGKKTFIATSSSLIYINDFPSRIKKKKPNDIECGLYAEHVVQWIAPRRPTNKIMFRINQALKTLHKSTNSN